jgi:S-methylmethionine-dependent homocysteine/selenocysteine methylase
MSKYGNDLPQQNGDIFLTDSGLETFLYFDKGIDLPDFAVFPLLQKAEVRSELIAYMERHIDIALDAGVGFILETPTWRANADWGTKHGYNRDRLAEINRDSVELMQELVRNHETPQSKMVVSGNIGPRGDGYNPVALMTPDEAQAYHSEQIVTFAEAGADLVTALTITHVGEAVGITRAAQAADIPAVISFTTETDGCIPEGKDLGAAIRDVDDLTNKGPAYYMINCAHPTHFEGALAAGEEWITRLKGIRANASAKSHKELDNSTELDRGNPIELGAQYRNLRDQFPHVTVLGGCCGTDHHHIECISDACRIAA